MRTCPKCNGTGLQICPSCNGSGYRLSSYGGYLETGRAGNSCYCINGKTTCCTCDGSGKISDEHYNSIKKKEREEEWEAKQRAKADARERAIREAKWAEETKIKWLNIRSEEGDADALYELGLLYISGKGVPKDPEEANKLIKKAASKGNEEAKNFLKKQKEEKEAREKETAEKLSKEAEQGDTNAQYELGLLYLSGKGVLYDSGKANELIRKAAAQGNQKAKDYLAKEAEDKRILRTIAIVFVLTVSAIISLVYYRTTNSFFKFQTNDQGTLSITRYSGKKEVVIPTTKKGVDITEIKDKAFYKKKLTSVIIPDSIITIGEEAFYKNQLTSVTIGKGVVSIGRSAFTDNNLTSVDIPDSVITIGEDAFSSNYKDGEPTGMGNSLTSVTIGNSVTSIDNGAFFGNKLTSVTIPDSVVSIGEEAFYKNQLTSVTIGKGVANIGKNAFTGNKLTSVVIPNNVATIDESAFADNNLTSITIGKRVTSIGKGTTKPITSLIGKWFPEEGYAPGNFFKKLELRRDGTGKGDKIRLKWKAKNERLTLNLGFFWDTIFRILVGTPVYDYKISGSTLTFTNNEKRSLNYKPITDTIPNAIVKSDTLELRSAPSMNSYAIKTLNKGDTIFITDEKTKKGWLEAEHNNNEGYVPQDQIVYMFPRFGEWKFIGESKEWGNTVKWSGFMVINEINKNSFSGYFDLVGKPGFAGREYFRGMYDPKTRKVSIQGYKLGSNPKGIALGNYEATLTEDGKNCKSGTWGGGSVWKTQLYSVKRIAIKNN